MSDKVAEIQGNYQKYMTTQDEDSRFQNADYRTGDSARFIQFCGLMGAPEKDGGFDLPVFNLIADMASAVSVSLQREGRHEARDISIGINAAKQMEQWKYGPQGRPVENDDKKAKK